MNMKATAIETDNSDVSHTREVACEAAERVQDARREFLKMFGYGTAGLMMGGLSVGKDGTPEFIPNAEAASAPSSPYAGEFQFAPGLLYMNIGTTGASPVRVVDDFHTDYLDIASNPTAYFFGQQSMRNSIAPGFGCDPYEIVMSFNTTDGLCRIIMGIPFDKHDEIITTNMEENAGMSATAMVQDRFGVTIKTVNIPTNDAYSDQEVIRRFKAQLTNKTRAILFDSPIYLTGARLPEQDLCQWAARKGVISIVDGAHQPGMNVMNLHAMGCDFFSGAGHKWQCGPGQTGFMYLRNGTDPADYVRTAPTDDFAVFGAPPAGTVDIPVPGYANTTPLPTYYPTNTLIYGVTPILLNGARNPDHNVAAVLQLVGNGSRPAQKALAQTCQMWDNWGRQNIEDYIVSLAQYLRARIVAIWGPRSLSLPYARKVSAAARTGLTSFNPFSPGFDYNAVLTTAQSSQQAAASSAAVATMRSQFDIVVRNNSVPHSLRSDPTQNAATGTWSSPLRISTHLFHSMADVDRVINALLQVVPHP